MPRMTAARAAVEILRREGISRAFGLPGAAINPLYRAMRDQGEISHTLARHVAGADIANVVEFEELAERGDDAPTAIACWTEPSR